MKIKLIPETAEELERFGGNQEIVHDNVSDYFVIGLKEDHGGSLDFHDWRGKYRFLIGSLKYFYEVINDERRQQDFQLSGLNGNEVINNMKKMPDLKIVNKPKKESEAMDEVGIVEPVDDGEGIRD